LREERMKIRKGGRETSKSIETKCTVFIFIMVTINTKRAADLGIPTHIKANNDKRCAKRGEKGRLFPSP